MDAFTLAEKTSTWIRNSVILKLIGIGILVLLLLIPATMLQSLINERTSLQNSAISEISQNWGNSQTIIGPVLTIPYIVEVAKDNTVSRETRYAHYLPEKLIINGSLQPTSRARGIYKATLYEADLKFSGTFDIPELSAQQLSAESILYNEAFLELGIPDMRGITKNVTINWNGAPETAEPGIPANEITNSGIHVPLDIENIKGSKGLPFSFSLSLNGSDNISFAPVGKETSVKLNSPWQSPSFNGSFLPQKRTISDSGFSAEWNILHFNRNYPQSWLGNGYVLSLSTFGVKMITPVQHYQMVTRSVKYAALIIFLTFILFFMVEITKKYRVHPFQYLLVGTALVLFYALLLSISEHITFAYAYLIAAGATTLLLSLYTFTILRKIAPVLIFSLLFSVLYIFLYIILQSEDYALLLGSTGLFILLGTIMYLTRKIDWYKINKTSITG